MRTISLFARRLDRGEKSFGEGDRTVTGYLRGCLWACVRNGKREKNKDVRKRTRVDAGSMTLAVTGEMGTIREDADYVDNERWLHSKKKCKRPIARSGIGKNTQGNETHADRSGPTFIGDERNTTKYSQVGKKEGRKPNYIYVP
jgi:hypothetical protein